MKRLLTLLLCSVFGLAAEYSACAADMTGRIIDGQDGQGIARARVDVQVGLVNGKPTDLVISSDVSGMFRVRNCHSVDSRFPRKSQGISGIACLSSLLTRPNQLSSV
jgi:hypothetical protein